MSSDLQWALRVESDISSETQDAITKWVEKYDDRDLTELWQEILDDEQIWEERWFSNNRDAMNDLSLAFPEVIFGLECQSCQPDNCGMDFWKNGMVSYQFPNWEEIRTYFPEKLKPYVKRGWNDTEMA